MAKTLRKKKTNAKTNIDVNENNKGMALNKEVILIGVCAFSVFLIVSIFTQSTGVIGAFFNKALFGFFGIGTYVLPFSLLIACLFYGFKKFRRSAGYKNILLSIIFLCIITLTHIIGYQRISETQFGSFFDYLSYYFLNGSGKNGGLLGAILGIVQVKIFGFTGAYIVIFAVIIICVVLVTGRSLFEALHNAALKTASAAKTSADKVKKAQINIIHKDPVRKPKKNFNFLLEPTENEPEIQQDEHIIKINDASTNNENNDLLPDGLDLNLEESEITDINDTILESENIQDLETNHDKTEIQIMDFMTAQETKKPRSKTEKIGVLSEIEETGVSNSFMEYDFPPIELLHHEQNRISKDTKEEMLQNAKKLEETLKNFGVIARVVQINKGPAVTRYELTPDKGVKVSKIVNLADDIALSLAANGIRIEAPVPGKSVVGIEVPNKDQQTVHLREILESPEFAEFPSKLAFGIGKDIGGGVIVFDIAKMPHLLIAGATGSGKSVCVNTLITSILFKASPNEVKLLLIDPKVVELSVYNGIPHLLIPVVTDPKKAAGALNWAVAEMLKRYKLFSDENVRDLKGYNSTQIEKMEIENILPQIVIIIDELADLMMAASKEVEDAIMRLAQMARAAGIHLIIATQRPSVDVITGVIKANIPSRLAFSVSSGTDSRTILDMVGAEKLLGKGDMLFYPIGMQKPVRVQGAFVSDKEVENIVNYVKKDEVLSYDEDMVEQITSTTISDKSISDEDDEFLKPALELIIGKEKASVSMLQRQFRIGYNRAARLMEVLEKNGFVGPEDGSKPRKVLITQMEYEAIYANME